MYEKGRSVCWLSVPIPEDTNTKADDVEALLEHLYHDV